MTTTFMYMSYLSVIVLVVLYMPLCIAALWVVNRFLKKVSVGMLFRKVSFFLLVVALFLLPTWDAILGKYYLDKYCGRDGGMSIGKAVQLDGVYMPARHSDFTAKKMLKEGYVFFEMDYEDAGYVRFSLDDKDNLITSRVDSLLSEYAIKSEMRINVGEFKGVTVKLNYQYIENLNNGEIVSGYRDYYIYGGYIDRILMSAFGGYYIGCDDVFSDVDRFSIKI